MKRTEVFAMILSILSFVACNKANDTSQISLTASTTQAVLGQTVSVTLTSAANISKWAVSPSTASQTYYLTTNKVNYFIFNQTGVYTVAVSAKSIAYDSARQSLQSCWNQGGGRGACVKGIDSASVKITVTK